MLQILKDNGPLKIQGQWLSVEADVSAFAYLQAIGFEITKYGRE